MRRIECAVTGEYLRGGSVSIGAAGSHNDVVLRLTFDTAWDGLTKKIIWQDARGEHTAVTLLTSSMRVGGKDNVYDVPIPQAAKVYEGNAVMSIKGVVVEDHEISATVTKETFESKIGGVEGDAEKDGVYVFTYANGAWKLDGSVADLALYGIAVTNDTGDAANGDTVSVTRETVDGATALKVYAIAWNGETSAMISARAEFIVLPAVVDSTNEVIPASQADQLHKEIDVVGTELREHKEDKENPHNVTKKQVGLENADNTSDMDKPISKAAQEAFDELEKRAIIAEVVTDFKDTTLNKYVSVGIYKLTIDYNEDGEYTESAYLIVTGSNGSSNISQTFFDERGASKSRFCYRNPFDEYWSAWWSNVPIQIVPLYGTAIGYNGEGEYVGFYDVDAAWADTPVITSGTPEKGREIIAIPNQTWEETLPKLSFVGGKEYDVRVPSLTDTSVGLEHPAPGWFKANVPVRLMFNGDYWLAVDYAGAAEAGVPGEEYGYGVHASETCRAGVKGYYWYDMLFPSGFPDDREISLILTKKQNTSPISFTLPYEEGDIISLVNGSKYVDCGVITHISENQIYVLLNDPVPFTQKNPVEEWDIDDRTIYVIEKPDAGVVDLGHFASGHGEDTFAIERASDTWGKGTRTPGQYGSARNLNTVAYYACDASGINTQSGSKEGAKGCHTSGRGGKALADYTDVGNVDCIAEAIGSILRGYLNRSRKGADYSDIGGIGNEGTAVAQFIRGIYAIIDEEKQYLEIMGNGSDSSNRSNARTLDRNGNEWLAGTLTLGAERYDVKEYLKSAYAFMQWSKQTIAANEFDGCTGLTVADFPYTSTISRFAFNECTGLKAAIFDIATSIEQYGFRACTAMVSADLPQMETIGSGAFAECYKLSDVTIPLAKTIGYQSFYKCASLQVLDAPEATMIGAQAFYSCSNLATLILRSTTVCKLENTNAFHNTPIEKGTGFIYVPDALVDSYKAAANWSTFAAQIKAISELG